jgi:hypothetical protein
MEYVIRPLTPNSPTSPSFPHAFSGNPGGIRTGPPIKTFRGNGLGSRIFYPSCNFQKIHFEAALVLSKVRYSAACAGLPHAS